MDNRRVAGLRREEVAMLAGVSVDYYTYCTRLERGNLAGVSESVLDATSTAPAYVRNGRLDILAANQLGRAVSAPWTATADTAGQSQSSHTVEGA